MDFLSKLQAVEDADTYDFTVRNPESNAPIMVLVLAGPTHPRMLDWKKRQDRNLSQLVKRNRDFGKAISVSVTEGLDDEDVAFAKEMDRLNAGTLGWKSPKVKDEDGAEHDGEPAPAFDAKQMDSLFRAKKWLRDCVGAELSRAENFTKSSASSSSPSQSTSSG